MKICACLQIKQIQTKHWKNAGVAKTLIVWTSLLYLFEVYHIYSMAIEQFKCKLQKTCSCNQNIFSNQVVNQKLQLNICHAANSNGCVHHKVFISW
jgi:hypothetical protein